MTARRPTRPDMRDPVERALARRRLRHNARRYPPELTPVPEAEWPAEWTRMTAATPLAAWRSASLLVVLYAEHSGYQRLTVQRVELNAAGDWEDGLTWDDLQDAKAAVGLAHRWAVEAYPPADRVVNVANLRHLFLLEEAPEWAW